ncbi:uncharacterized protein LOC119695571 [Motacilla alba alba]|uniref:uncharacterized protein LOC119695571 n=1 Tax=Motacilla alba alba TaxID=1094192 RepID=UPI0018D4F128|nr:uncharacterized protein LOC119695571 [Motacilla alba alba]
MIDLGGLAPDFRVGWDGRGHPTSPRAPEPRSRVQPEPRETGAPSVLAISTRPAHAAGLRMAGVRGHPCPGRLAPGSCLGVPEPGSATAFGWHQPARRAVSRPPLPLLPRAVSVRSFRGQDAGDEAGVRQGSAGHRCFGARHHQPLTSASPRTVARPHGLDPGDSNAGEASPHPPILLLLHQPRRKNQSRTLHRGDYDPFIGGWRKPKMAII